MYEFEEEKKCADGRCTFESILTDKQRPYVSVSILIRTQTAIRTKIEKQTKGRTDRLRNGQTDILQLHHELTAQLITLSILLILLISLNAVVRYLKLVRVPLWSHGCVYASEFYY